MKNKKLLYVLVPLTLIVWGLIFYRIFKGMNDQDNIISSNRNSIINDNSIKPDTFELIANYRDPFLSGSFHGTTASGSSSSKIRQLNTAAPPVAPDVQYYGIISNTKSKHKIGLVRVMGKNCLLKEGETTGSQIKIVRLFSDSILLIHQKNKYIIKRK